MLVLTIIRLQPSITTFFAEPCPGLPPLLPTPLLRPWLRLPFLRPATQGLPYVSEVSLQPGINALLNYGYAVLLSTVLQKLFGVGLDPTYGIFHVTRERAAPLAYDLMEPFRQCVDWRVFQWIQTNGTTEVTKDYRRWVTGFPLEKYEYLELEIEVQGIIEGVIRSFRRAVLQNQVSSYRPWTPLASKWVG